MQVTNINYLESLINDLFSFENELIEISTKVYPSESLRNLIIDELIPLINYIKDLFLQEKKSLLAEPDHVVSPLAKAAVSIWNEGKIKKITYAISKTDLKSYPLEIMNVFKDIISEIDSSNFEIITVPQTEFNFSFSELWLPFKKQLETNINYTSQLNKRFIQFEFPESHKDNVFLAGIYAHEVGHYLDIKQSLWAEVFTEINQDPLLAEIQKCVVDKQSNEIIDEAKLIQMLSDTILGCWIREAFADCFAIYLLGPAFLFSTMDMILNYKGSHILFKNQIYDSVSVTHPPQRLRNNFQLELLRDMGIFQSLDRELQSKIEIFNADLNKSIPIYPNKISSYKNYNVYETKELYDRIMELWCKLLPSIKTKVEKVLGDNIIKIEDLIQADKLTKERLIYAVPPNELDGVPANTRAIINAGWIARLMYKKEICEIIGNESDEKENFLFISFLNNLLKYSLQVSRIQGRWNYH